MPEISQSKVQKKKLEYIHNEEIARIVSFCQFTEHNYQLTSNMMFYMLVLSFSSKEKRELKYILVSVEYLAR